MTQDNTIATPRAYLFDEVFAYDVTATCEEPAPAADEIEAMIEAARQEGYARGQEDGKRAAAEANDAKLASGVDRLLKAIKSATAKVDSEMGRIEEEAVHFALSAARKLASALIERQPAAELEALLRVCLSELRNTPHLVVRVCVEQADELSERLEVVSRETGFAGEVVVLPDNEIAPGDGRIDWADGGLVRHREAIDKALEEAVNRFLAARAKAPAERNTDDG